MTTDTDETLGKSSITGQPMGPVPEVRYVSTSEVDLELHVADGLNEWHNMLEVETLSLAEGLKLRQPVQNSVSRILLAYEPVPAGGTFTTGAMPGTLNRSAQPSSAADAQPPSGNSPEDAVKQDASESEHMFFEGRSDQAHPAQSEPQFVSGRNIRTIRRRSRADRSGSLVLRQTRSHNHKDQMPKARASGVSRGMLQVILGMLVLLFCCVGYLAYIVSTNKPPTMADLVAAQKLASQQQPQSETALGNAALAANQTGGESPAAAVSQARIAAAPKSMTVAQPSAEGGALTTLSQASSSTQGLTAPALQASPSMQASTTPASQAQTVATSPPEQSVGEAQPEMAPQDSHAGQAPVTTMTQAQAAAVTPRPATDKPVNEVEPAVAPRASSHDAQPSVAAVSQEASSVRTAIASSATPPHRSEVQPATSSSVGTQPTAVSQASHTVQAPVRASSPAAAATTVAAKKPAAPQATAARDAARRARSQANEQKAAPRQASDQLALVAVAQAQPTPPAASPSASDAKAGGNSRSTEGVEGMPMLRAPLIQLLGPSGSQ